MLEKVTQKRESSEILEAPSHCGKHRIFACVDVADFFSSQVVNVGLVPAFGGHMFHNIYNTAIGYDDNCTSDKDSRFKAASAKHP